MLTLNMDHTIAGVLYLLAVVFFVLAAFWSYAPVRRAEGYVPGVNWVALGLALAFFVPMYENFAAS